MLTADTTPPHVQQQPGVWLFHCHIEWHVQSGLIATFVEAPLDVQRTTTIPPDHLAACARAGVPTAGNAAANTADLRDLAGENAPPGPLPAGYVVFLALCACVREVAGS